MPRKASYLRQVPGSVKNSGNHRYSLEWYKRTWQVEWWYVSSRSHLKEVLRGQRWEDLAPIYSSWQQQLFVQSALLFFAEMPSALQLGQTVCPTRHLRCVFSTTVKIGKKNRHETVENIFMLHCFISWHEKVTDWLFEELLCEHKKSLNRFFSETLVMDIRITAWIFISFHRLTSPY